MSEKNLNEEIDKLEFVRIFTPQHIPKYLVEQIKDRDFSVDQFYEYQEINCIRQTETGPALNPLNMLYVIVDEGKVAKGFCWMVIDPLSKDLIIQTYSMDKSYWGKGRAVKLLSDKVKEIIKECALNKVYWITKYPKHSMRHGFKPSKNVLMEYKEDKDGIDSKTGGASAPDEPATEGLHQ